MNRLLSHGIERPKTTSLAKPERMPYTTGCLRDVRVLHIVPMGETSLLASPAKAFFKR